MEVTKNKRKNRLIWATASVVFVTILGVFCLLSTFAHAAFNPQINYQGKLTTHSNVVADDGDYVMEFKLYASSTGGAALWTETRTGVNKVTLTNGLFSVMLGEVTALPTATSFFNQALFLEVSIGTTTPAVLSPRKKLGAVPAALYANDAGTVGDVGSTSLLRSDLDNAQATITNLTSTNFFAQNASITRATSTNFFASVLNAFSAFFMNLTATIATITNLTATNSTTTNATTTNLFATTINAVTGIFTNLVGTNVTSTNLVGIGTTTLATTSISRLAVGTSSMTAMVNVQGGAGVPALLVTSSTGASLLAVDDNGNVGIGTNAPAFKLDIYGDTNLSLGSYYKYNGVNLVYASTTLSNFFFGNAGNLSMTGTDNLGIGSSTLTLVSSGSSNLAFGNSALAAVTTGYSNLAFGTSSLAGLTVGYNNIAIGNRAGSNLVNGYNNIIIGNGILTAATTTANSLNIGNLITGDLSQGNVGIGSASMPNSTTTIYNDFVVGNGALTYSSSSGVTSVDNMEIGAISFPTDSGIVTWTDMPLTASTTSGVPVSYTANLAGNPILSVAGISNGAGDLSSFGVSVGTTTVLATLAVQATTSLPALSVVSSSGSSMLHIATSGNIGIGTSTPNANLNIFGNFGTLLRVATSTNQNIFVIDSNGNVAISNGLDIGGYLMDSTNSIGTNGQVLISTGTSTKWVATSTFGFLVSETDPIWLAASTSYFKLSANNTATGVNSFTGTTTLATTTAARLSVGTSSLNALVNFQAVNGVPILNISSSSGSSLMVVDSNGNVGVNTANPGNYKLNVVGTAGGLYVTNAAGNYNSLLVDNKNGDYKGVLINHNTGAGGGSCGGSGCYGFKFDDKRINNLSGTGYGPEFYITRTGSTTISNIFQIDSHSVVGLAVSDLGFVGIGTSTPNAALNIYGTSSAVTLLRVATSTNQNIFVIDANGNVAISNGLDIGGYLMDSTNSIGTNGQVLISTGTSTKWVATTTFGFLTTSTGLTTANFATNTVSQWVNNAGYITSSIFATNNTWTGTNTFATETASRLSVGTTSVASMLNIQGASGVSALNITSSTGASMFTVASNGNVGIGTATPASVLHVRDNSVFASGVNTAALTATFPTSLSVNGSVKFGKFGGANNGAAIVLQQTEGTDRLIFRASVTAGAIVWDQPEIGATLYMDLGGTRSYVLSSNAVLPYSNADLGSNSYKWKDLYLSGNEYINGNVGIGTSTPSGILDIPNILNVGGSIGGRNNVTIGGSNRATATPAKLIFGDSQNTGTAQPFLVFDGRNMWAAFGRANTTIGAPNDSMRLGIIPSANGSWPTMGTNPFSFILDGSMGIGSTTPTALLTVQGTSTNSLLSINTSSSASSLYVSNTGNVGIGTTTPNQKFVVNGNTSLVGELTVASTTYIGDTGTGITFEKRYFAESIMATSLPIMLMKFNSSAANGVLDVGSMVGALSNGLYITEPHIGSDRFPDLRFVGDGYAYGGDISYVAGMEFNTTTKRLVFDSYNGYTFGVSNSTSSNAFIINSSATTTGDFVASGNLTTGGTLKVASLNGLLLANNGIVTAVATSSLNLTTASFASANISQWVNDAGYVTAGGVGANFWSDNGTALSPVTSTRGLTISGTSTLADVTVNGNLNVATGKAYQYNGVNIMVASTTLDNYFFGGAGNLTMSGNRNTATGYDALVANIGGGSNTAYGYQSLFTNTSGSFNTAFGQGSLFLNNGAYNTAIGNQAMNNNSTGSYNSAIGMNALFNSGSGSYNVANGYDALFNNVAGNNNVGIGYQVLWSNVSSSNNVVIGYSAMRNNTSSTGNTVVGYEAGGAATSTNQYNSLFGYQSGLNLTTGSNNLLLGYQSGDSLASGSNNIIIGSGADATTSSTSNFLNIGNTIYGDLSSGKIGVGTTSLVSMMNIQSTAGTSALNITSSTGDSMLYMAPNGNIGIGTTTPSQKLTIADGNILIANGNLSIVGVSTTPLLLVADDLGSTLQINNIALGLALEGHTTALGPAVSAVGVKNGLVIINSSADSVYEALGAPNTVGMSFADESFVTSSDITFEDQLGLLKLRSNYIELDSANGVLVTDLGNGAVCSIGGVLTNTCPSSIDYKHDVASTTLNVEALLGLQVKTYVWNNNGQEDFGLIAEEVKSALPELYQDDGKTKGYRADHLPFYLLQIAQNQTAEIKALTSRLNQVSTSTAGSNTTITVYNSNNNFSSLTVADASTFYGTMTVFGEAGFESKVTFKNDVEIQGKLYLDKDQLGTVMIPTGTTTIEVMFTKPYNSIPKVLLNLNLSTSSIFVRYAVTKKSTSSFFVIIDAPVADDLYFDWVALGLREGITDYTASSTDNSFENLISIPIAGSAGSSTGDAAVTGTSSAPVPEAGVTSTPEIPVSTTTTPEVPAAPVVTPEAPVTTPEVPTAPAETPPVTPVVTEPSPVTP